MWLCPRMKITTSRFFDRTGLKEALFETGVAKGFIEQCPLQKPTDCLARPELANSLGIGNIVFKIENDRLGLTSFKALGGAYAIIRTLVERFETETGRKFSRTDFQGSEFRNLSARTVFTAATDGNHGLSVAAGARVVGAKAVIFVHERVPDYRVQRLKERGADVRVVAGVFDDAVAEASRQAKAKGWILVADTSDDPADALPGLVLEGYTVLADEMVTQSNETPTHIFLQAGVGGLAAACIARWQNLTPLPSIIIVEPEEAPALFASAQTGELTSVPENDAGEMEMLECYRPSALAWDVILPVTKAFQTVSSREAKEAVTDLAIHNIATTPSGAAGFAGLREAAFDPNARRECGLNADSVVWIVISEGPAEA